MYVDAFVARNRFRVDSVFLSNEFHRLVESKSLFIKFKTRCFSRD